MSTQYIAVSDLLSAKRVDFPQYLDAMRFDYKGIRCHVFGVLHGLTGGTNRGYKELVNRTIAQAPGLRLGEMRFSSLYSGLHDELDDWMQIPLGDAFWFSFALHMTPIRIARLFRAFIRERIAAKDRFGLADVRRLQDIGGSAAFHSIAPDERRRLAGFPGPARYLQENIARRQGSGTMQAPVFPDKDWEWLTLIEPFANIPLRSIHMLEYGVALAREKGASDVSLFVGEIHNSDMAWYAQNNFSYASTMVAAAIAGAMGHARNPRSLDARIHRVVFNLANAAGSLIPTFFYLGLASLVALRGLQLL